MSGRARRCGGYRLLERLGRGATCEVWRARRAGRPFSRALVVKRLLPELAADPGYVEVLAAEAKLAMRLRHPNVVRVFGVEQHGDERLLVMEHLGGGDLRSLLRAQAQVGPPHPGLGALVVRDVCRALAHAHAAAGDDGRPLGIVHRDVSPANVVLSARGAVKLVDFGVARALARISDEKTRTASLKGNLAYMAPEQLALAPVDARADLFAAGVVLYEALTARRLFKSAVDLAGMRAVRRQAVPAPSSLNAAVPLELDRICARAMALEPGERFASAAEMAEALDEVVAALGYGRAHLMRTLAELRRAAPAEAPLAPERVTKTQGAPGAWGRRWAIGAAAIALAAAAAWIVVGRASAVAAAAASAASPRALAPAAPPSPSAAPSAAEPPLVAPSLAASSVVASEAHSSAPPAARADRRRAPKNRHDFAAGKLLDPFDR
ncbi:MAG TPA: serine/threonine-protein kinase [Polyangia bacterium]|nr:serine/threonine-protein kinase [Polyangia bacterium]